MKILRGPASEQASENSALFARARTSSLPFLSRRESHVKEVRRNIQKGICDNLEPTVHSLAQRFEHILANEVSVT